MPTNCSESTYLSRQLKRFMTCTVNLHLSDVILYQHLVLVNLKIQQTKSPHIYNGFENCISLVAGRPYPS